MKINPAAQNLSLVLKALDQSVAPELTSATAKESLGLVRSALLDLLQRQRHGPATTLIQKNIDSGETLERDIWSALDLGSPPLSALSPCCRAQADFEALIELHHDLTIRINDLCIRLSAAGGRNKSAHQFLRRAAEWEFEYYNGIPNMDARPFGDGPEGPPPPAAPPLSREFLQEFLIEKHGPLEVTTFSSMLGGYGGKQTFLATLKYPDGRAEDIVVRKSDPVPAITHSTYRLDQEYDLLQSLGKTTFPSPPAIDQCFKSNKVDGTFFTMKRLPGRVPGTFLGGHEQKLPEKCPKQLAELLAQLHAIPLETLHDYAVKYTDAEGLDDTIETRYRRNLKSWREYSQRVEHMPSPFMTWLFHWLESNVPVDTRRPVLTHGDFNFHNVLVDDNENITSLLDWECSDFGAPEQDLAYIKPHITKHIEWDQFLTYYRKSGGQEIDERHYAFCAAYSVMKIFLAGIRSSMNIQRGINRDIRYVMMELGFARMLMQMGLGYTEGVGVGDIEKEKEVGVDVVATVPATKNATIVQA